jgi:hypothetical protein
MITDQGVHFYEPEVLLRQVPYNHLALRLINIF